MLRYRSGDGFDRWEHTVTLIPHAADVKQSSVGNSQSCVVSGKLLGHFRLVFDRQCSACGAIALGLFSRARVVSLRSQRCLSSLSPARGGHALASGHILLRFRSDDVGPLPTCGRYRCSGLFGRIALRHCPRSYYCAMGSRAGASALSGGAGAAILQIFFKASVDQERLGNGRFVACASIPSVGRQQVTGVTVTGHAPSEGGRPWM